MEMTLEQLREQLDTTEMLLRRTRKELDSAGIATVPTDVKQASSREYLIFFLTLITGIVLIISSLCIPVLLFSILSGAIGVGVFFYSLCYYIREVTIPDLFARYNELTKQAENLRCQIKTPIFEKVVICPEN